MRRTDVPVPTRDSAHPSVAATVPLFASLAALSSGVVWSFGAILARLADDADAFQYNIWRSVAIVLVIEVAALARRRPLALRAAYGSGPVMLVACASLLLASVAFIYAVKTTTPANAAFLSSITPLVAVLLARVTLREPLTAPTVIAVAVAFVGLVITVVGDLDAGSTVGNIAALLAAVGFAGYAVCVRTEPFRDWSPVLPGYAVMMIVLCTVVTVAGGEPLVPPARDIGLAALHGGVIIVVGTLLFNLGARHIPAVAMSVFAQTEMLFVPIWAFIVLSERPTNASLVGGLLIFGAVIGKAVWDARPARA